LNRKLKSKARVEVVLYLRNDNSACGKRRNVIEYYLRRNFPWYNSEIWFQVIPDNGNVTMYLAKLNDIVYTPKIEMHLVCLIILVVEGG